MTLGIEQLTCRHRNIFFASKNLSTFFLNILGGSSYIIDTHQVTREKHGYSLNPFSLENLKQLDLSEIWFFYASSEEIIRRINKAPSGRTLPTSWDADFHTFSQLSIVETYSVLAGIPIYMFDTHKNQQTLASLLAKRI